MKDVLSFTPETTQGNFCATCEQAFDASFTVCPNDGTVFAEVRKIEQLLFGRYQILSVVGSGGSGTIYKGKQQPLGRLVAIKMLKTHSETQVARFRQEAQVSSSLDHPNIIHVYDFGTTQQNQPFMVMDYVDGGDLSELIKREGIPNVTDALHIFRQICDGMQHAHNKGIIHRDLKPSNVMLSQLDSSHPVVRIVDFGIAKALQPSADHQNLTSTAELFGSPYYMSPEQALGRPLDGRSDIYALGCIMYEALTFALPIASSTPFNTLRLHVTEKPLSIAERCPNRYSHELENIVMKCLAKDPARRFPSMNDLKHALDSVPEVLSESRRMHITIPMKARQMRMELPSAADLAAAAKSQSKLSRTSGGSNRTEMMKLVVITASVITMVGGISAFCLSQFSPTTKPASKDDALDRAISNLKHTAHKPLPSKNKSSHDIYSTVKGRADDRIAATNNSELTIATDNTDTFGRECQEIRITGSGHNVAEKLKRAIALQPKAYLIFITQSDLLPDSLDYLKTQKQITHVNISRSNYPEEVLHVLKDMPQLVGLTLGCSDRRKSQLTDAITSYIKNLKHLIVLDVSGQVKLTEASLENLPSQLEDLHLKHDRGLSRSNFGALAKYKNLRSLDLCGTKISDAGLNELKRLPALENLDLGDTAITDDGADILTTMPKLRFVDLSFAKVSRDGLLKLATATNLKEVCITDSESLSNQDFADFRKASQHVKLTPEKLNVNHESFFRTGKVE